MAMSSDPSESPTPVDEQAQAMLRAAATELRSHVDGRWVEVADSVVSHALLASRSSWPVRAEAPGGPVHVAEQVLVSCLRDSIDPVEGCEVVNVAIDADRDVCTGVTIAIAARYGAVLIPLADQVRSLAERRLEQLLGPVTPPVTVAEMHVHVTDVEREDPKL